VNAPDLVEIRPFTMDDISAAYQLWQGSAGVGLSGADEPPAISAFLQRNPGCSFVAVAAPDRLAGTILCGHDGRRGYLYHLAVAPAHRRQGIATELVQRSLSALAVAGIQKCHLFIFHENETGLAFWQAIGWTLRHDIQIMSHHIELAVT